MFDFVNRRKGIVQVIMGLAVLPFLFWGVESYRSGDGEGYVAIVDGEEIQRREFEQALRDQQERMRNMLGEKFDSSLLDNVEVRNSVLERLIQQRLLHREAVSHGFTVLDSQVVKVIQDIPEFQQDNQFSKQQYEEFLNTQGINPLVFESRVRQEVLLQQLLDGYSEHGFVSDTVAQRVMYLSQVQREINQIQIDPDQFLSQIIPDEAAIKAYYDSHQTEFYLPERVRVEYLVLSLDELAKIEPVTSDEARKYFDGHQNEFGQPEERQASHILISASAAISDDEKQIARNKAEDVLAKVRQNPENFAGLAKEFSDDPGSANQGGDLGFFGRGVMVKAFEDKIYQMQPNEISGLVETDFGFHIIKLSAVKGASVPAFETVRGQIEQNLKRQKVGDAFGEIAEDFSNFVYEQSDNLQAAAERFELPIQKSEWIDKDLSEPAILANEKVLEAIFSDDAIKDRRNTEAIEVMPDTFVSARILDHKIAAAQSITLVKDKIVESLKKQLSIEMAVKDGQEKLARLQAGEEVKVTWGESKQVSYMQPKGVELKILQEIFKTELTKLPAYTGISNPEGGYSLVRINRIIEPDTADKTKFTDFSKQLQQMITQEEMSSYLAGIRQRYEVTIKQESF